MSFARYFLHRLDDAWLVSLEGRAMARCASREEALEMAIVMADLMGAMHHDADVMVSADGNAPLELVWSFRRDKLPSRLRKRRRSVAAAQRHLRLVQHGEVQVP